MKAAKIAFSSLIVTSMVFAVACADKRGFRARKMTPEEVLKITGQKPQGPQGPGAGTATAPVPKTSEPRASSAGSAPSLSSGDEVAMSGWAILVNESTRSQGQGTQAGPERSTAPVAAQAGAAGKSSAGEMPSSDVAEAAEKLKEINEAALRAESIGVIKGKTATLVAKGSGADAKLELGLDALLEIVSRGEKQEISVHGKAELSPEVQIGEKKIVRLELKGKGKVGTERKVEGVEAYGACMSTLETPKDCKQAVVMILVKASDKNKFGAITFYQVNPAAANGLLEKIGSSLGDQYKSFEEARISAPVQESGAASSGGTLSESTAGKDEAERKPEPNRSQTLAGEPTAVVAPAPAPKEAQPQGLVPSKNKPHPDVADTVGNNLPKLKERFMNWWNGDKAPEAQKPEQPKKEEQGEKSPLEQRGEEASPFAHGA